MKAGLHLGQSSFKLSNAKRYFSYANEVDFLPLTKFDLNKCKRNIVQVEEFDHPCFKNQNYVRRKNIIQEISNNYNIGDEIPIINYLPEENEAWNYVTSKIFPKMKTNCCKEINENFDGFRAKVGISNLKIPQLRDVSNAIEEKTGFTICPVGGLLSPKVFLNALAFKVFCSTMFIRPLERAEYSGEPDILHEIIGHTALLADPNFAEFSQDLGIASLGATAEQIKILANIYWFTVEYGLVKEFELTKQGNKKEVLKVYGGGIIPSCFEIDYALQNKAKYWELDFKKMQEVYYDYVNLSTNYFIAESFDSMKSLFKEFYDNLKAEKSYVKFDKKSNTAFL